MIKWYKKLYYRIMSSRLIRRRYYIYKHCIKNKYYVKTTKLFCRTKYIKNNGPDYILDTHKIKDAIENYALNSVEDAEQTIKIYADNYENRYKLDYQQINKY